MVRTRIIGMTSYAELQCTTNFSFLRGASHAEELAAQAKHLGLAAIAVTDRNTLAGVVRAHRRGEGCGLQFVVGARLDLAPTSLTLRCIAEGNASKGAPHVPLPDASRPASRAPQHEGVRGPSLLAYPTNRAAYGRCAACSVLGSGGRKRASACSRSMMSMRMPGDDLRAAAGEC